MSRKTIFIIYFETYNFEETKFTHTYEQFLPRFLMIIKIFISIIIFITHRTSQYIMNRNL